jgi:chromosome segregation ATPase
MNKSNNLSPSEEQYIPNFQSEIRRIDKELLYLQKEFNDVSREYERVKDSTTTLEQKRYSISLQERRTELSKEIKDLDAQRNLLSLLNH